MVTYSPKLLAGNIPVEVPGDALGGHEGEDLGVLRVRKLQEARQQSHQIKSSFLFRVVDRNFGIAVVRSSDSDHIFFFKEKFLRY